MKLLEPVSVHHMQQSSPLNKRYLGQQSTLLCPQLKPRSESNISTLAKKSGKLTSVRFWWNSSTAIHRNAPEADLIHHNRPLHVLGWCWLFNVHSNLRHCWSHLLLPVNCCKQLNLHFSRSYPIAVIASYCIGQLEQGTFWYTPHRRPAT